ncbi:MAG: hypothetical protein RBU21_20410 [FCB group bacterium]|jgi:hypothetical protein|nr:hypothetical protein [FCB group bacterium]
MADEVVTLASLGLESYEIVEVHRSDLKNATYNPRILNDAEKRKLREGLRRHGLVAPTTWNSRTGNIVGGHQRVSQLDALAGTKNYRLRVAAIDVDEAREKELNVLLNNPNAQGDWDIEALSSLLHDETLNLEGMGFDHADVYRMLGESPIIAREDADKLDELADKVRAARSLYDGLRDKSRARDSESFYLVLVGRDEASVSAFLERHNLPDNRYQSLEEFERLMVLRETLHE